jgi:hypothetical protein
LSNWYSLAKRKEQGGLGIPDIRILNMCLLASWVQRYYDAESKLWREIVDYKYQNSSPNLFAAMVGAAPPFGKVFYGVLVTLCVTAFLITVISILIMHLVNQDPNQTKGKFDLISK